MLNSTNQNAIFRIFGIFVAVFTMTLAIYIVDYSSSFFKTSVVGVPQHDAFDGTVYPVQKVPNWVKLTTDEYKYDFNSIPSSKYIDIPYYDPNQLKISTDNLQWGDPADDLIRNAKITYSVPYMGNYQLDGHENAGSHLAVDIKIPMNTPIYAIANGTVSKAKAQSSGFGNHIVIQHNNFPTLNSSSQKDTLYSSYSHLSSILVSDGDVVKKGQHIGYSGDSGTSTTPHLHFQLDNSNAPWHPFWPFTSQEAADAGLDFFSAINSGLGKEKALSTTVNPMKYVQTYLDGDVKVEAPTVSSSGNSDSSNNSNTDQSDDSEDDNIKVNLDDYANANLGNSSAGSYVGDDDPADYQVYSEDNVVEEEEEEPKDPPELQFDFQVNSGYNSSDGGNFTVLLRDQYGSLFKDGFTDEIVIKSDNGLVTVDTAILKYFDFENGRFKSEFRTMKKGKDRLYIEHGGEKYYSDYFEITDSDVDEYFSDVSDGNKYYDAIQHLAENDVIAGYSDGTFKPEQTVSRVEALKLILEGINSNYSSGDLPFSDTSDGEWYHKYLYTAYKKQIVDGYEDGSFRPSATVNRAEFYKILFNGMNVDVMDEVKSTPFEDVDVDDWFAPYVAQAKKMGIVDSKLRKFRPSDDMTRGEVAEAMYRVMGLVD